MKRRHTKIIATLGPATDDPMVLRALIQAGVNLVRLNFSHGTHQEHQERIEKIIQLSQELGCVVGLLVDLQGPKIRIARFLTGSVVLQEGAFFCLDIHQDETSGDVHSVGVDYTQLDQDVQPGDCLLLDDGRLMLRVHSVQEGRIQCRVEIGGVLSDHKGINRKGGGLTARALTQKDEIDLRFALQYPIDYVALSFPRDAEDIVYVKRLMTSWNREAGLIAKIERIEAITNLDAIIEASDGVMVARGDLAVEIGDAEVPLMQKEIIDRAKRLDKPVIIATQMMESMIHENVPTRAEVSDVANAVLDNVDAVMLSAETASGHHPVLVVETVARVCLATEKSPRFQHINQRVDIRFGRIDEAIAMATMYTANHLDVQGIVSLTESGMTPLWMSRIRSDMVIYGLSRYAPTLGRMTLYRGVYPIAFDPTHTPRDLVNQKAIDTLVTAHAFTAGDCVILTKGDYMGIGGGSNTMKILQVGSVV